MKILDRLRLKNWKNITDINLSEEEQAHRVRQWWRKNGLQIVIGAVLGLAGFFGWNMYQDYLDEQSVKARTLYLRLANSQDTEAFGILARDFKNHNYTAQAHFVMAKYALRDKNFDRALAFLKPLFAADNYLADVARLRTAEIYFENGQFDQALETLGAGADFFAALYDDLKGDIYLARNDIEKARTHYEAALTTIGEDSALREIITIKLDDLN